MATAAKPQNATAGRKTLLCRRVVTADGCGQAQPLRTAVDPQQTMVHVPLRRTGGAMQARRADHKHSGAPYEPLLATQLPLYACICVLPEDMLFTCVYAAGDHRCSRSACQVTYPPAGGSWGWRAPSTQQLRQHERSTSAAVNRQHARSSISSQLRSSRLKDQRSTPNAQNSQLIDAASGSQLGSTSASGWHLTLTHAC